MISLVDAMFKEFGALPDQYEIRLNSRKLMDFALKSYAGLSDEEAHRASKLIDRRAKMPADEFNAQVPAADKLLPVLDAAQVADLPGELQEQAQELAGVISKLNEAGISNVKFDPSIMRGFDYYTDIVFEVFDLNPENNRSMLGGGRYDGLVGLFGVDPVPTVGFGWGDVTLENFLEGHGLLPKLQSETQLYVALAGDVLDRAQPVIAQLRAQGVNVAVDLSGRKIGDQLKAADKKGISRVLIIGANELESGQFTLKDLVSGDEQQLDEAGLLTALK
jgi:histidyl-tRNA synthetase